MNGEEEFLDLVDKSEIVVDRIEHDTIAKLGYRLPDKFIKFANGFIINSDKQIWVPTRGNDKLYLPGGLDFSVGESLQTGETYEHAIIRAFSEEAGLTLNIKKLKFAGKLIPSEDKTSFESIFVLDNYHGVDPKISPKDFVSAQWLSLAEFELKLNDKSVPSKSAILPALTLVKESLDTFG